jgi:hypothetical protein
MNCHTENTLGAGRGMIRGPEPALHTSAGIHLVTLAQLSIFFQRSVGALPFDDKFTVLQVAQIDAVIQLGNHLIIELRCRERICVNAGHVLPS